jgi:hypothetical protein
MVRLLFSRVVFALAFVMPLKSGTLTVVVCELEESEELDESDEPEDPESVDVGVLEELEELVGLEELVVLELFVVFEEVDEVDVLAEYWYITRSTVVPDVADDFAEGDWE